MGVSRLLKVKVKVRSLSCVWLFATPWTVAYQASPSMRFFRQEYRSGLPFLGCWECSICWFACWLQEGGRAQLLKEWHGLLFSCSVVSNSFATLWTVAHQAPLSIGFPRQEYWSGLPFPSPEDLPDPGMEPVSPAFPGGFFPAKTPGKPSGMAWGHNIKWLEATRSKMAMSCLL